MESIKKFSDTELLEQITNCENDLNNLLDSINPHEGDIGYLKSELYIARKEADKRKIL